MANLRARLAAAPFESENRPKSVDRDGAVADITIAAEQLEQLLQIAETSERLSLLASAYKRLALVSGTSSGRRKAVVKMVHTYLRAVDNDPANPYPLINALGGIMLLGGPWDRPPRDVSGLQYVSKKAFAEGVKRARELALEKEETAKTFWDRIHNKDLALVQALARGELRKAEGAKKIARGYLGLWHSFGSPGDLSSPRAHVAFLRTVINGSRGSAVDHLKAQLDGLTSLEGKLNEK
jgi:hypothetical protein